MSVLAYNYDYIIQIGITHRKKQDASSSSMTVNCTFQRQTMCQSIPCHPATGHNQLLSVTLCFSLFHSVSLCFTVQCCRCRCRSRCLLLGEKQVNPFYPLCPEQHCTIQHDTALKLTNIYYTTLKCTVLHFTSPHLTAPQCVIEESPSCSPLSTTCSGLSVSPISFSLHCLVSLYTNNVN